MKQWEKYVLYRERMKKNNWNAIYSKIPVKYAWEIKKIGKMIDEIIGSDDGTVHDYRPDIDEIRNPVDNDRRKLNEEK
jgi:hypothetical protein